MFCIVMHIKIYLFVTMSKQSNFAYKNLLFLFTERMYWPQGNYSLLETIGGCPSDIEEAWFKGSRLHWSNGQSFKSNPFHLIGNYSEKYYKHRYLDNYKCFQHFNSASVKSVDRQTYRHYLFSPKEIVSLQIQCSKK